MKPWCNNRNVKLHITGQDHRFQSCIQDNLHGSRNQIRANGNPVQLPKVVESHPASRWISPSHRIRMKLHLKPRYTASDPVQQDISPSDPIQVVPASMPVPEPLCSLPAPIKQKVEASPPSFSPIRTRSASKVAARPTNSVPTSETSRGTNKSVPLVRYPQGVTTINIVTVGHINFAWTIVCSVNNLMWLLIKKTKRDVVIISVMV